MSAAVIFGTTDFVEAVVMNAGVVVVTDRSVSNSLTLSIGILPIENVCLYDFVYSPSPVIVTVGAFFAAARAGLMLFA